MIDSAFKSLTSTIVHLWKYLLFSWWGKNVKQFGESIERWILTRSDGTKWNERKYKVCHFFMHPSLYLLRFFLFLTSTFFYIFLLLSFERPLFAFCFIFFLLLLLDGRRNSTICFTQNGGSSMADNEISDSLMISFLNTSQRKMSGVIQWLLRLLSLLLGAWRLDFPSLFESSIYAISIFWRTHISPDLSCYTKWRKTNIAIIINLYLKFFWSVPKSENKSFTRLDIQVKVCHLL